MEHFVWIIVAAILAACVWGIICTFKDNKDAERDL